MAVSKKKVRSTRWWDGDTPIDELEPSEQVAHHIVLEFGDLAPSVDRIMNADLTATQRLRAIEMFRASLATPHAPHRDPRNAIDAARTSG
jgi:hypothetical protein